MEFLKVILGDELYNQFAQAINAYNGNEANKDNQIKIGNLGSGEYVGKGKYDALETQFNGKVTELDTANNLIAELKKSNKGNEGLQQQITTYEGQVAQLQEQLKDTKIKSAIKVALLSEKADDVDYLAYKLETKLKEENKTIELDDNDNIKNWNDILSGLKTQFPKHFEVSSEGDDGFEVYKPNRLKKGDGGDGVPTKEQFKAMSFEERMNLKKSNENLYKQYAKN